MNPTTPTAGQAALGPMLSFDVSIDCDRVCMATQHDGLRFVTRLDRIQAHMLSCELMKAAWKLGFHPSIVDKKEG